MNEEITIEELKTALASGARAILQVRHAERPKMDPDDPTFGDSLHLTDEGRRTAKKLGEEFADYKSSAQFLASPLTRTVETAELIAEGMGINLNGKIATDDLVGNGSFFYDDPLEVMYVFKAENFFNACFTYFQTGELRGFKNLYTAADGLEEWLEARFKEKLFVVSTHDCFIAAFLSARGAAGEFTRDNWPRFLDAVASLYLPDGSKKYAFIRTNLSDGVCGVGGKVL